MTSTAKTAAVWGLRLTALAVSLLAVADARAQSSAPTAPPAAQAPAPLQAPAPQAPAPSQTPAPPQAPAPAQAPQVAPSYPAPPPAPYVTPTAPVYSQPGYPPQPGMPPPQAAWRPAPQPSKALLITGVSILGGSYLIAVVTGASLMDEDKYPRNDGDYDDWDCRYCDDIAPYLFIPIAGPFVAMSQTPDDAGLLMLGMAQIVGTALTVGGIVRYRNTKRDAAMQGYGSWKLGGRRELAVDMSSSLRMAGPRMTLRF